MAFMQRQITEKQSWIEIETSNGTVFVQGSLVGFIRDSQTNTHQLTDKEREKIVSKLTDYCEGTVEEWKTIQGYGARLYAPGYMDCTEWTVFDTEEEAEQHLEEMYGDDQEATKPNED